MANPPLPEARRPSPSPEAQAFASEAYPLNLVARRYFAERLDTFARAVAREALEHICGAERCVCGHFHCHHATQHRGTYACDDCDCKGFEAQATTEPSTGVEPPNQLRRDNQSREENRPPPDALRAFNTRVTALEVELAASLEAERPASPAPSEEETKTKT